MLNSFFELIRTGNRTTIVIVKRVNSITLDGQNYRKSTKRNQNNPRNKHLINVHDLFLLPLILTM